METNFWEDRRRRMNAEGSNNESSMLASLPRSLSPAALNSKTLFKELPSIREALPTQEKWSPPKKAQFGTISSGLQSLVDSIPLIYSSVRDVYDSGNEKNPSVIIIQDVHLHPEAQSNIASVLQELIDQEKIDLVGVEGAFDALDFSPIRSLSHKKVTEKVARAFLENKLLAAPSYVGITSQIEPPLFLGIDDEIHHEKNVDAYLTTRDQKGQMTTQINTIKRSLNKAKHKIFSRDLRKFDDVRTAYQGGSVGMGPYVKRLASYETGTDFVIEQFLEAYQMESTLDFKRVDRERKIVIEKLAHALDKQSLSNLLAQSLSYRMGRLSFGDYYQYLKDLCRQKGIDLLQTPSFDNYVRYVLLSDGIRAEALFSAIEEMEKKVLDQLIQSPKERLLAGLSRQVGLIEKLMEFSLTPNEWTTYKEGERDLAMIFSQTKELLNEGPINGQDFLALNSYETFYHEAEIRSQVMVDKLLGENNGKNKVLITGGFHTPEIAELLRHQKVSYLVVSPKITKIESESGSSYLSVFAREKTPLQRLFAGEKLFVNPTHVNVQPHLTQQIIGTHIQATQPLGIKELPQLTETGANTPLYVAATTPDNYELVEPLPLDDPSRTNDEFGGVIVTSKPSIWKSMFPTIKWGMALVSLFGFWGFLANTAVAALKTSQDFVVKTVPNEAAQISIENISFFSLEIALSVGLFFIVVGLMALLIETARTRQNVLIPGSNLQFFIDKIIDIAQSSQPGDLNKTIGSTSSGKAREKNIRILGDSRTENFLGFSHQTLGTTNSEELIEWARQQGLKLTKTDLRSLRTVKSHSNVRKNSIFVLEGARGNDGSLKNQILIESIRHSILREAAVQHWNENNPENKIDVVQLTGIQLRPEIIDPFLSQLNENPIKAQAMLSKIDKKAKSHARFIRRVEKKVRAKLGDVVFVVGQTMGIGWNHLRRVVKETLITVVKSRRQSNASMMLGITIAFTGDLDDGESVEDWYLSVAAEAGHMTHLFLEMDTMFYEQKLKITKGIQEAYDTIFQLTFLAKTGRLNSRHIAQWAEAAFIGQRFTEFMASRDQVPSERHFLSENDLREFVDYLVKKALSAGYDPTKVDSLVEFALNDLQLKDKEKRLYGAYPEHMLAGQIVFEAMGIDAAEILGNPGQAMEVDGKSTRRRIIQAAQLLGTALNNWEQVDFTNENNFVNSAKKVQFSSRNLSLLGKILAPLQQFFKWVISLLRSWRLRLDLKRSNLNHIARAADNSDAFEEMQLMMDRTELGGIAGRLAEEAQKKWITDRFFSTYGIQESSIYLEGLLFFDNSSSFVSSTSLDNPLQEKPFPREFIEDQVKLLRAAEEDRRIGQGWGGWVRRKALSGALFIGKWHQFIQKKTKKEFRFIERVVSQLMHFAYQNLLYDTDRPLDRKFTSQTLGDFIRAKVRLALGKSEFDFERFYFVPKFTLPAFDLSEWIKKSQLNHPALSSDRIRADKFELTFKGEITSKEASQPHTGTKKKADDKGPLAMWGLTVSFARLLALILPKFFGPQGETKIEREEDLIRIAGSKVAWWFEPLVVLGSLLGLALIFYFTGFEPGTVLEISLSSVSHLGFVVLHWKGVYYSSSLRSHFEQFGDWRTREGIMDRAKTWGFLFIVGLVFHLPFYLIFTGFIPFNAVTMSLSFAWALFSHFLYENGFVWGTEQWRNRNAKNDPWRYKDYLLKLLKESESTVTWLRISEIFLRIFYLNPDRYDEEIEKAIERASIRTIGQNQAWQSRSRTKPLDGDLIWHVLTNIKLFRPRYRRAKTILRTFFEEIAKTGQIPEFPAGVHLASDEGWETIFGRSDLTSSEVALLIEASTSLLEKIQGVYKSDLGPVSTSREVARLALYQIVDFTDILQDQILELKNQLPGNSRLFVEQRGNLAVQASYLTELFASQMSLKGPVKLIPSNQILGDAHKPQDATLEERRKFLIEIFRNILNTQKLPDDMEDDNLLSLFVSATDNRAEAEFLYRTSRPLVIRVGEYLSARSELDLGRTRSQGIPTVWLAQRALEVLGDEEALARRAKGRRAIAEYFREIVRQGGNPIGLDVDEEDFWWHQVVDRSLNQQSDTLAVVFSSIEDFFAVVDLQKSMTGESAMDFARAAAELNGISDSVVEARDVESALEKLKADLQEAQSDWGLDQAVEDFENSIWHLLQEGSIGGQALNDALSTIERSYLLPLGFLLGRRSNGGRKFEVVKIEGSRVIDTGEGPVTAYEVTSVSPRRDNRWSYSGGHSIWGFDDVRVFQHDVAIIAALLANPSTLERALARSRVEIDPIRERILAIFHTLRDKAQDGETFDQNQWRDLITIDFSVHEAEHKRQERKANMPLGVISALDTISPSLRQIQENLSMSRQMMDQDPFRILLVYFLLFLNDPESKQVWQFLAKFTGVYPDLREEVLSKLESFLESMDGAQFKERAGEVNAESESEFDEILRAVSWSELDETDPLPKVDQPQQPTQEQSTRSEKQIRSDLSNLTESIARTAGVRRSEAVIRLIDILSQLSAQTFGVDGAQSIPEVEGAVKILLYLYDDKSESGNTVRESMPVLYNLAQIFPWIVPIIQNKKKALRIRLDMVRSEDLPVLENLEEWVNKFESRFGDLTATWGLTRVFTRFVLNPLREWVGLKKIQDNEIPTKVAPVFETIVTGLLFFLLYSLFVSGLVLSLTFDHAWSTVLAGMISNLLFTLFHIKKSDLRDARAFRSAFFNLFKLFFSGALFHVPFVLVFGFVPLMDSFLFFFVSDVAFFLSIIWAVRTHRAYNMAVLQESSARQIPPSEVAEDQAAKIASQLVSAIKSNADDRPAMAEAIFQIVETEEFFDRAQFETSGRRIIQWDEISLSLRSQIETIVLNGDLRTEETANRLADLLSVLKITLTEKEYRGFVGPLKGLLSAMRKENKVVDVFSWLDGNIDNALPQASETILPLLSEEGELKVGSRVILILPRYNKSLIKSLEAKFKSLIDSGQVQVIIGRSSDHVLDLLNRTKRSGTSTLPNLTRQFLVPDGTPLPPDFFDLSKLSSQDRKSLENSFFIYIIISSIQYAVEIKGSHLPNWKAFRDMLVQA